MISAGSGAIVWRNASNGIIQFVNASGSDINFTVGGSLLTPFTDAFCYGSLIGLTLGSLSADFVLVAYTMLYVYDAPVGG